MTMAEQQQNYKNHARLFPLFHFVALPIMLLNFLYSVWQVWRAPSWSMAWAMVVAFGLAAAVLASRLMALAVQDRVIRLEMQLRLARVLPPAMAGRIAALDRGHFVALRFASDEELPGLVTEICEGRLQKQKDIKLRVKNWQADHLRA
jgi:hypothetical protein